MLKAQRYLVFCSHVLRLFADSKKLCSLNVGHNQLSSLPAEYDVLFLEELYFQQNEVILLPADLLQKAFRYWPFTFILIKLNIYFVYHTLFVIFDITCCWHLRLVLLRH